MGIVFYFAPKKRGSRQHDYPLAAAAAAAAPAAVSPGHVGGADICLAQVGPVVYGPAAT